MTFNSRYYCYRVSKDGSEEFLHTELSRERAIAFATKHKQMFRGYAAYYVTVPATGEKFYV